MNRRMDIAGQSFIVTGAAKGIGLAISSLFHSLGARVSGWDLHDSGMKDNPVFADSQIVDVTDPSQTEAGFAASLAVLGDIDGIVANAGVNGPTKPLWDYSLAEWQTVMSVDLTGVFLTVQPALDHLRARQRGRIIIISSIAGKEGNPGAVPYGAAKAGVIGLAKGLARELLLRSSVLATRQEYRFARPQSHGFPAQAFPDRLGHQYECLPQGAAPFPVPCVFPRVGAALPDLAMSLLLPGPECGRLPERG